MGATATALPPVPAVVCLVLCALSFLAGRFTQQAADLPDADKVASRRALIIEAPVDEHRASHLVHPQTVAVQKQLPKVDPLDPVALEQWVLENSGLGKVRPPVPVAQSGDNFVRVVPYQILSWMPRAVLYPGFVDKARCEHIIRLAEKMLYPSGLAYRPGEAGDPNQQTRTSKGTFMTTSQDGDGVLAWVEEKIAAVTMIPRENGEAFNVLKYENKQHYDSHYDYFDPKDFGPQPSQRIATVLIYLADVQEGGETVFKREGWGGDKKDITDWRNCNDGSFKYKPRQGDALLFWGVDTNLTIDQHSLHGGCPVVNGTKWAMTKWLRNVGGPPTWLTEEQVKTFKWH